VLELLSLPIGVMGIAALVLYAFKYKPGKDRWIWKIVAVLYTILMFCVLSVIIIDSIMTSFRSLSDFTSALLIPLILLSIYFCLRFAFYKRESEPLTILPRRNNFFGMPPVFRLSIITLSFFSLSLSCIPFILTLTYDCNGYLGVWWLVLWGLTIVLLLIFPRLMLNRQKYSEEFRFNVTIGVVFVLYISLFTMAFSQTTTFN